LKYSLKGYVERSLYRVTGPARTVQLKDGIAVRYYPTLLVPSGFGNFELVGYEKHYTIKSGDIVVDGGGFLGLFALFASKKVGPTGRVIVYEPDPGQCHLLERNLKLNHASNVTLVRKGLWSCTTELHLDPRGNASNIDFAGARRDVLVQTIQVTSLDDEIVRLGLPRVDLVKMNIEGAEIEAIEGCRQLMQHFPVNFVIAANHYRDNQLTAARVKDILEASGYKAVIDYPAHLSVYAWRRS
jgi:FkbM family methyltransferase